MQVKDIMQKLECLAPPTLKEDWDNIGLQIGDPDAEVKRVLLALTPSLTVVQEAVKKDVDLIVTHHPFIFKGVKTLRTDTAIGRMSQLCIKHDVALYAAHTNLDIAENGVNDVLAERLGLVDIEGLVETQARPRYKVVVFVPHTHLDVVKEAMFAAYVENPDNPKLMSKHLVDAISKTVPLSTTMKEQIAALRNWAATRAKNASNETPTEEKKEMPILLTRPELELERSFDLNNHKENK